MSRLITLCAGALIGAAAAHFLDPALGARRRNQLRDTSLSKARRGASQATTAASKAAHRAKGAAAAAPGMPGSHRIDDVDDVTLARKVETEIFRDAGAPKGDVSVEVQERVVHLRGMVADGEWIDRLAEDA